MRCFCRVEYDGSAYCGWQVQNNEKSIQAELERAFSIVTRAQRSVVGAGRTDAGVHAQGQGMHVDLPETVDCGRCQVSVNALLPADIAIYNLQKVPDTFHARYGAIERCYKYYMIPRKMPLLHKKAFIISYPVDWDLIERNIPHLIGRHDFTAFCASGFKKENKTCAVREAFLEKIDTMKIFTITADRFVYKMVRSIVGTLLEIGSGKITASLEQIIQSRDRLQVGQTALACGLILDHVTYNEVE